MTESEKLMPIVSTWTVNANMKKVNKKGVVIFMPTLEDVEPPQQQLVEQVEDDAAVQQNAEVAQERPAEDNDVEFVKEK
jgi:hypothetical protein